MLQQKLKPEVEYLDSGDQVTTTGRDLGSGGETILNSQMSYRQTAHSRSLVPKAYVPGIERVNSREKYVR